MQTLPQALTKWWRDWTEANSFRDYPDREVEQMAKDAGLSPAELRRLVKQGPVTVDLLPRRMAALDLDRKEVSETAPATFQDMERVCSFCESRRRCARDLRRNPADPVWKDYCPNAQVFEALDAMPWAARREW
jgi:hypothetical protein